MGEQEGKRWFVDMLYSHVTRVVCLGMHTLSTEEDTAHGKIYINHHLFLSLNSSCFMFLFNFENIPARLVSSTPLVSGLLKSRRLLFNKLSCLCKCQ